jgi:uncharacterized protein (UPF0332 family)
MKEKFLNRAKENLKASELLFDAELYNASANRAYYAAFHIAVFAIYSAGVEPAIDHRTVLSLFSDLFINRRKIFSSKYKVLIYDMQNIRNVADYGIGINKIKAIKQLKHAKAFYELIIGEFNV